MSFRDNLAKIKEGDKILVQPEKQYAIVTEEESGCIEQCVYGRPIMCTVIELKGKLFLLSDIFSNLKLGGKRGYDNAWDIINRICKEIYGISASPIDREIWEKIRYDDALNVSGDYWVPDKIVDNDEWRDFYGILISSGNGEKKRGILFTADKRMKDVKSIIESSESTCGAAIRFLLEVRS